jgi:hypothetical protein
MKTDRLKVKHCYKIILIQLFLIFLVSCGQLNKTPTLIGEWGTNKFKITVRTRTDGNWQFISDSCSISLTIKEDFTVDGKIGLTDFKNGKIKTNWLLPVKMTNQPYTIKCGLIGKIFENDPIEEKKIEFWLQPIKQDTIPFSIRYTEGGATFPMAHTRLIKEK